MNTPYTNIFDLFMQQVEDYRLIDLYDGGSGENNLNNYLLGFMTLAIPEFYMCNQDLANRNDAMLRFNFEMTSENQKILSKLMVKEWMGKELKDVLQMRWSVTDYDFKHFSEAQNTKSKQDVLSALREECSQLLLEYQVKNNDWKSWYSGNFS